MAKATDWNAKRDLPTLMEIAKATVGPVGYGFADPAKCKALTHNELIEFNMELANPENAAMFAARATAQGIQESGVSYVSPKDEDNSMSETFETEQAALATNPVGDTKTPRAPRNPIKVEGVTLGMGGLPEQPKGAARGRKSQYPFADLAAPQRDAEGNVTQAAFFFIPNTDGREGMRKLVGSNVAVYNSKVKDQVDPATGQSPNFKAYDMTSPEGVAGVAVYRVR